MMPRERLAKLMRDRREAPRSPDALHKARQEAASTGFLREDGRPGRAAQGLLSAREREGGPVCIVCDGRGMVYSLPDNCGDEWLVDCDQCEGTGHVRLR